MTQENEIGKSGVKNHPAIWVLDSTKIQTFMASPRLYFWSHVLGFRSATPNHHLWFGSCWHAALEYIHLNGYEDRTVVEASQLFMEMFKQEYPDSDSWDQFDPKTPANAISTLFDYAKLYGRGSDEQVLFTEVAGALPLSVEDEGRVIHFKQDVILKKPNGYWCREHKTTSYFSKTWEDSWKNKFQVGTYNLALYVMHPFLQDHYGEAPIQGVEINGAMFQKSTARTQKPPEERLRRVPIHRNEAQLQKYLFEANHWLDQIQWNFEQLAECSPEDNVMTAFPCNGEGCSQYGGCAIAEFCEAWPNPLRRIERPPLGFKVDFWDPRKQEEEAKNILQPDGSLEVKK